MGNSDEGIHSGGVGVGVHSVIYMGGRGTQQSGGDSPLHGGESRKLGYIGEGCSPNSSTMRNTFMYTRK